MNIKIKKLLADLSEPARDPYGSEIWIEKDGVGYNLYTTEHGNPQIKMIGLIVEEGNTVIYKKSEDEKDIHRNSMSWSVASWVLPYVDEVRYSTNFAVYTLSSAKISEIGKVLNFNFTKGYQKKVYVRVNDWIIAPLLPKHALRLSKLGYEWFRYLHAEFEQPYMKKLGEYLAQRRKYTTVYPSPNDLFRAYKLTSYMDVKVVIIGREPYADGSADGLAFSTNDNATIIPPTLQNILTEVESDYYKGALMLDDRADLTRWAEQGVLMLNTVLTVEKGKPLSHANKGWEKFTEATIKALLQKPTLHKSPIVFILWGSNAQQFEPLIQNSPCKVIKSDHPSSFTASKNFFGTKPFSSANAFLAESNLTPIGW